MLKSQELRNSRDQLRKDCKRILDAAEAAGRSLNVEEQRDFDAKLARVRDLEPEIQRAIATEARERGAPAPSAEFGLDPDGRRMAGSSDPLRGWTADGREVRLLRPEHRLRDFGGPGGRSIGEYDGPSLGQLIRGAVTGRWPEGRPPESRVQGIGDSVLGGLLVPSPVALDVIDKARAQAVLLRAGALTMPMDGAELTLCRIAGDPVASWRQENADIGVSDLTFDAVVARPRRLGCIVKSSVELAEDSPNFSAVVESALAKAMALELDRVGLSGLGAAAEPMGIANWPGVQTIGTIAQLTDYSDFSSAVQKVAEQNGTANAVILSPRDFGTLDRLEDSTGQPLQPSPSWLGLQKFVSTQARITLGAGGAESEAFVGDFTKSVFALRTELLIEASRQASDTGSSAFSKYQVWIRAVLRADFLVLQEKHFTYMSGITL